MYLTTQYFFQSSVWRGGVFLCILRTTLELIEIDAFLFENNALFTSSYNEVTNLGWVKVSNVDLTKLNVTGFLQGMDHSSVLELHVQSKN